MSIPAEGAPNLDHVQNQPPSSPNAPMAEANHGPPTASLDNTRVTASGSANETQGSGKSSSGKVGIPPPDDSAASSSAPARSSNSSATKKGPRAKAKRLKKPASTPLTADAVWDLMERFYALKEQGEGSRTRKRSKPMSPSRSQDEASPGNSSGDEGTERRNESKRPRGDPPCDAEREDTHTGSSSKQTASGQHFASSHPRPDGIRRAPELVAHHMPVVTTDRRASEPATHRAVVTGHDQPPAIPGPSSTSHLISGLPSNVPGTNSAPMPSGGPAYPSYTFPGPTTTWPGLNPFNPASVPLSFPVDPSRQGFPPFQQAQSHPTGPPPHQPNPTPSTSRGREPPQTGLVETVDDSEDEMVSSASAVGDPDNSQASFRSRAASEVSRSSVPARTKARAPRDEEEDNSQAQRLVAHTKALLAKLKPLAGNLVVEREKQAQPSSSLGQWAHVGIGHAQEPDLAFLRSDTVDTAVRNEFEKVIADRCSQSQAPKGVPLRPSKDRLARFQGNDDRPLGYAPLNLHQPFHPRSRKHNPQVSKALKVQEETARRLMNGLNQLDALKNAAATTMLQRIETDPSSGKRSWKEGADPDLLLDILHNQHQTIEHLAQTTGHLYATAVMDRRAEALSGSSTPQDIQKTLLRSSAFAPGLFEEAQMEKAKKELESEAVSRSLYRSAYTPYKKQHQQHSSRPREGNPKRTNAPNKPRQPASSSSPAATSTDRSSNFQPARGFKQSFPKGNFHRGRMLPGKKK